MIASVFAFVCTVRSVKTRETQYADYMKADMIEVEVNIVCMETLDNRALDHISDRACSLR